MAFWAYILKCADGSYYTGHTDDLELRLAQHHSGHFVDCYTRSRRPLELMWAADFPTRIEALESERQIKNWSRAKKEALIRSDWKSLSILAMPPKERSQRTTSPSPFVPSEVEGPPCARPVGFTRGGQDPQPNLRHCERSEAIPGVTHKRRGLLRYARNDDLRARAAIRRRPPRSAPAAPRPAPARRGWRIARPPRRRTARPACAPSSSLRA